MSAFNNLVITSKSEREEKRRELRHIEESLSMKKQTHRRKEHDSYHRNTTMDNTHSDNDI